MVSAGHTVSVATFDARVIAAFGRHLLVREASGRTVKARPFGRELGAVCGDDVRCRDDPRHGEVHVIEVLPRRTALYRSNARGGVEPVLANLTRLLVVIAPVPPPDPFVADRYLAAAESAGIAATPVLNKAELGIDATLRTQLDVYAAVGYECMTVSATTGDGVDTLLAACAGHVAALVGQSGVGKSSLVRQLVPDAEVEIGGLMRDDEGRHTTTVSRLYELPGGENSSTPPAYATSRLPWIISIRGTWGFWRWRASLLAVGSTIAGTCASPDAPCGRPWSQDRWTPGAMRAIGACGGLRRT